MDYSIIAGQIIREEKLEEINSSTACKKGREEVDQGQKIT